MNYTSIEQSKKLLSLGLKAESADMLYTWDTDNNTYYPLPIVDDKEHDFPSGLPCWSVGALMEIMPKQIEEIKDHKVTLIFGKPKEEWSVMYFDWTGLQHGHEALGAALIEATYNMVVWLLENNYIKKE